MSVISSKLKFETSCTRPSSRTSKSDAFRSRTTAPDLSRTMTSTETTFRRDLKTDCGGDCRADGADDVAMETMIAAVSAAAYRMNRI